MSLQTVEDWLLERYSDSIGPLNYAEAQLYTGVVSYIGETYRRNLGGTWIVGSDDFELNDPFSFLQDSGVILDKPDLDEDDRTVWPEEYVLGALRDRTGDLLRGDLKAQMDPD